jgi:hypothetical protein
MWLEMSRDLEPRWGPSPAGCGAAGSCGPRAHRPRRPLSDTGPAHALVNVGVSLPLTSRLEQRRSRYSTS